MRKANMRKVNMQMSTPTKNKKIPMRQCVGCGQMNEKKKMYRVLRTQEGELLLDKTGRQNGRGAYICPNEACLQKAIRRGGLERSFKMQIPKEMYQTLEEEMKNNHAE